MIKIQMTDGIIEQHKSFAKQVIEKRAYDIFVKGEKIGKKKPSNTHLKKVKKFLNFSVGKDKDVKEMVQSNIVTLCTSSDINALKEGYDNFFKHKINKKQKQILEHIFSYDIFKNRADWNRHTFINSLNIKVCPYCNRNYISNYVEDGKNKTTSTVDHYYTQGAYPHLAINIYNMVPSCNFCNNKKGKNDDLHLYPYTDESDSLKFQTSFSTISQLYNFNVDDIKILLKHNKNTDKCKNSEKVFKLKEIYEIHKKDIFILKNQIKDYYEFKDCMQKLENQLGKELFEKINITDNYFPFLASKFYEEPLCKRACEKKSVNIPKDSFL